MLIFKDIFLSDSNGYISVIVWPRATDNNMVRVESEHVPIEYSVNRLVPSLSYLKVNWPQLPARFKSHRSHAKVDHCPIHILKNIIANLCEQKAKYHLVEPYYMKGTIPTSSIFFSLRILQQRILNAVL
jgi:hypothetical protein